MTDIRIEVSLGALPQAMVSAPGSLIELAQRRAIDAAGPFLQRKLYDATPQGATSLLRIHTVYEPYTFAGQPQGFVGPIAPALYAEWVEKGRRPGRMPPEQPIAYWVQRVLRLTGPEGKRVTYLVRRKIARQGTKATNYIAMTVVRNRDRAQLLMRRAAVAAIQQGTGTGAA